MLTKVRRPSPSLVISLLALFVALGGTVYAAGNQINGKTIKAKSIPGNRLKLNTVTGRQIKESTLAQVPTAKQAFNAKTAETATNALNAVNAEKVDGHTAICPNGTQLFLGGCWENAPRAATTAAVANETCGFAGGALPGAFELASFSRKVTLGNTDEWTDTINTVTGANAYTVVTVSKGGEINFTNATDTKEYRCVLPLLGR